MDVDQKRTNCIAKYKLGWSITEISRSENVCRQTVYTWIDQYNNNVTKV